MAFLAGFGRRLMILAAAFAPAAGIAQAIDEIPLPAGSRPAALAPGLDGNIWFAEEGGNRIGRLTPAGILTEFALPNPDSRPHGVTAVTDGVLVTEGAGRIAHVTSAGVITETSTPGFSPQEISPGPFAQSWWVDPTHDRIGSSDERGVSVFGGASLSAGARPEGVTPGDAQDIWVTENGSGRITRFYRQPPPPGFPGVGSLQSQEFPLPDPTSGPWGVCFGPDGNVWFTERAGGWGGSRATGGSSNSRFPPDPSRPESRSVRTSISGSPIPAAT